MSGDGPPDLRTPSGTAVWVAGEGPTVVLVHGVLMDHRMWAPQVEALSTHYRMVCLDMLGHGQTPDRPGARSLDDFVAQVEEVIGLFSDQGAPVLGGFSMGGLITQAFAARHHRRLAGAMILNAVYERTEQEAAVVRQRYQQMASGGVATALQSAGSRWFTDADRTLNPAAMTAILGWIEDGDFASKVKAHQVFSTGDRETAGRLGEVSCPSLVMTGEDDAGSTPRMARDMARALPDASLVILEGQRHMMTVLDAGRVNAAVADFLGKCFAR